MEIGRLRHQIAVLRVEPGAHPFEASHVQVDGTSTDLVPAGQRHPGSSAPREERPEDDDRRADLPDQLVRRLEAGDVAGIERGNAPAEFHPDAEVLEHLGHDRAVPDPRHVCHHAATRRQQRGSHELEGGVLRARHLDGAGQTRAPGYEEAIHGPMVPRVGDRPAQPTSLIRAIALAISPFARPLVSSATRFSHSSTRCRAASRSISSSSSAWEAKTSARVTPSCVDT